MNYQKIYNNLINKGVVRNWSKKSAPCYVEKHHILPKCLGGDNSSNNLVCLTAKEHYIAHLLLAKIHGGKLWHPVKMMSSNSNNVFTGSMYEIARIKSSSIVAKSNRGIKRTKEQRLLISKNHARVWLGRKHDEYTKLKMSESQLGSKNHNFGKKASDETKSKMSESHLGRKHTVESINKMKENLPKGINHFSFKGYYHTHCGKFTSTRSACVIIGCSPSTILRRIKNENFPEYWFEPVTKIKES